MAKQKKNSNYVTDKTSAAKAEREAEKLREKKAKDIKLIAALVGGVLGFIAIVFAILFAVGVFEYKPEVTDHATITFDDGTSLHVELYGHDAEATVEHFIDLCESGYFDGLTAREFASKAFYLGSENADGGSRGVKGEFEANGVENKIPIKKGTVCLSRGESYDSGYGQFFILTGAKSGIKGNYAAFGRVTEMDALNSLIKACEINGTKVESAPKIVSVSLHEAHH